MAYTVGTVSLYDTVANLPPIGSISELYHTADTGLNYTWNGSAYVAQGVAPRVVSIASSATPTINVATTDLFKITALAVAITGVTITGTPVDGQQLRVRIVDNGTARAITWGSAGVGCAGD
jgi:hypothetical protein